MGPESLSPVLSFNLVERKFGDLLLLAAKILLHGRQQPCTWKKNRTILVLSTG